MLISELFINPRRDVVYKQSTFDYFIDVFNGKTHIYESVYYFEDEIDINKAIVDKIYLDFDIGENNFFENTKKVAQYLYDKNIKFYIRFSGRGFHIFIMLDHQKKLKNPKMAIKQYVNHLHKVTNTTSDPVIVGDLTRLVRIPNTINIKSHKYCIAITYDMLMNHSYKEICELATHPGPCYDYYNGCKNLDISKWDKHQVKNNMEYKVNTKTTLLNNIPPCIKKMMEDPKLGWRNRTFVITCLRDLGYTRDEIESILFKFLTKEKFEHCILEDKQLEYLVDCENILFPSCKTLKEDGLCVDETCNGHGLYY